ncbi:rhomboid family intramembrane serine protease [Pelagibacterium montanilacus]|uniref:rhomboid family intramembrane serine protease n=1 Tax=Pelagibacterium montanilacus TaxID=2185280 RepID=UPI000F8E6680|nr:rhomboid family intramembrane serine protease [Pelagibacterium montanilacus]
MFLPLYDSNKIAHIEFPVVNYALIAVTVLVFLVQVAGGQMALDQAHIEYGMIPAVVTGVVEGPAPWLPDQLTLFTYIFLHADFMHLATNMLFLWVLGDNIEDALGHVRYLAFYLLAGAAAALAHMGFNLGSYGPLIGASGAVAGVIGAYMMLYPNVRIFVLVRIVIPLPITLPAWTVLGLWIGMQFFSLLVDPDAGVAWWAHIGGFAAGVVLVVLMRRRGIPLWRK